MTVRINKDAINLREKLSQLDKPSGLVGEELLRADTSADAREALNLEEHLFEDFESTGIDDNATSTAVTIDISGSLLVGKTSTPIAENGHVLFSNGQSNHTATDGVVTRFIRKGNDGDISIFYKDSSIVGSIGVDSNAVTLDGAAANVGLRMGGVAVLPRKSSADSDGQTSLGTSGARFKDLYLSGGVYLGGTGAANKLDDYEEGTWTPTITGSTGGTATVNAVTTSYTKIGNTVRVDCFLNQSDVTGLSGAVRLSGLPFTGVGFSPIIVSYCNLFDFDETTDTVGGFTESAGAYVNLTFGSASTPITATNATETSGTIMFHATYKTNQ